MRVISDHSHTPGRRTYARKLSVCFAVLAALLFTLAVPSARATTGCKVTYAISSQWPSGFGAAIAIQNTGTTALSSWTLTWTFANGQTISQLWNGTATQSGSNVTVTNMSYDGSIAAGATLSGIGFNGTWNNATNAIPTSFAVNGTSCNGSTPPAGSFTIAPSASTLSIAKGASATDTIAVTDVGSFSGAVTLAASGLPSGVTASFGTNPTTGSSMVTFAASSAATAGTSTIIISGTSGSLSASTTIALTVTGTTPTGSFSLAPSASTLSIAKSASATDTISVTDVSPFSGAVTLAASGLPSGVTASFGTNPTTGSSMVTFAASSAATAGTSTITISGTSGSLSASTTIALTVTGSSTGSFSLKPSASSLMIALGAKGTETITITDVSPFSGSVTLAASGLPSGVTAAFGSNPSNNSSLLTLTVGSTASAGTSTITITGTSGSLSATTTFNLTVSVISVLAPGDHNESITSGGLTRTFIVHIPTGYTGSVAMPAIIDFHPLGGSGSQQEGLSGWNTKCNSVGCIVAYPDSSASEASDGSWNVGYCCDNAEHNAVNDEQFGRDIITWLKANTNLDAKRVYASGGSNGAGMAYTMACRASDVIAAAAAVDFRCSIGTNPGANAASITASNDTACQCPNIRPITVVAWDESQENSLVPYNGGPGGLPGDCPPGGSCMTNGFISAKVNAETFADFAGCTGSPTTDPDNSLCQIWTSCKDNTTVELCTHQSSGHLSTYSDSSANWIGVSWNRLSVQTLP